MRLSLSSPYWSISVESLSKEKQEFLQQHNWELVQHELELDYGFWTAEQILHAVMPEDSTDIPSSFTQVGHIAHMNLRENYYPWKHLIGEVILDVRKLGLTERKRVLSIC